MIDLINGRRAVSSCRFAS